MSDRPSNILTDLIPKLPAATGDYNFEGLIIELLKILTGRHFHSAKPGYQAGRDMSSRFLYSNTIFVECKRYKKTTELNERELLGELYQAKDETPDLDVWVLVTSRDVDSKLYESLYRSANEKGIDFAVIADGDGETSTLAVLCANSSATVKEYLKSVTSDEDLSKLENELNEIAKQPQFSERVNRLKEKFLSPLVGYENWRVSQNKKLLDRFKFEKDSRAVFGQSIYVEGDNFQYVERTELTTQLDNWYSTWGENKNIFAVLGEEGDGKTWGVARWLGQKIQLGDNFPGVVFISSNQATTNDPYQLFSEVVARSFANLSSEQCNRRIKRWINKTTDDEPILLLVLDGINERQDFQWWRLLIDCLIPSPWANSVAVLITCRNSYWQSTFGKLGYLSTKVYMLPSYTEKELTEALKANKINRSQLPKDLFSSKLIYKPRYFDLVIKHQEKIGDVGKITVPRLIYEDRKDRWERNNNIALTDDDFQQIIKDLAAKRLKKAKNKLNKQEIEETFSFVSSKIEIFRELQTGGILREKRGSYQVEEKFFSYGFGLLLVDNLADAAESGETNLEEVIAQWLEPNAGMDIKGEICHFASLISLGDTDIPQEVKVILLLTWVNSQNPKENIDKVFIEYLPVDPEAYINLAKIVWSDKTENPWAQELLMRAFIRWQDNEQVVEKLIPKLEQWLGFVHLYGFPHPRRSSKSDREIEQIREDICQCVGQKLEPGQAFTVNEYQLTAIDDDGLLRLGRVALKIIDYLPVKPFIKAIVIGATAEAIMGFTDDYRDKYDLFQWIFASADDNLRNEIESEVKSLKAANNLIANRVAYFLLSWEGSTRAFELRKTLPDDLFPTNHYYEKYKQDPCQSFFYRWSESDCLNCLMREDITIEFIAEKITPYCINPEFKISDRFKDRLSALTEQISIDSIWSEQWQNFYGINFKHYEPALCAYAPTVIVDLVRQILRAIVCRSGISLRQLCFEIEKHSLILEEAEKQAIYQTWQQFDAKCDYENHWGNLLLCQYGQKLSFSNLKNRAYPSYLGIAIRNRGMQPEDVLSKTIALRPDLVDKWLEPIQGEQSEIVRKIIRVGTLFYETLCYVLLEQSHSRAIELYRYLSQNESHIILKDARTNTRYLDYALFQASSTESVEQEWLHRLENCHCDTQLMELAIVAQLGQGESWLLSRIEWQLKSSAPGDFSQAVTMLTFLETDKAIEQLKNIAKDQPDTWRKKLVDISIERWQRNSWAKHWFREFLNQSDRIMAWRGFRLFLQCVDQRFWLWKEKLITEASSHDFHQEYLNFLEDNEDTIKNAIRNSKYNQELDKTFLCHKTS